MKTKLKAVVFRVNQRYLKTGEHLEFHFGADHTNSKKAE